MAHLEGAALSHANGELAKWLLVQCRSELLRCHTANSTPRLMGRLTEGQPAAGVRRERVWSEPTVGMHLGMQMDRAPP